MALRGQGGARRDALVGAAPRWRALLAAGIIDDVTLSIVPRILGDGVRLFDVGLPETGLRLVESRSWASGLVQLRYEVERPSP